MKSTNRIEILVDKHEMDAHRFFQSEHARLSGQLYRAECNLNRKMRIHTGGDMNETQDNAFLLAYRSTYKQLGTLERIMDNLRALAAKNKSNL
jgi:hypothetical protein